MNSETPAGGVHSGSHDEYTHNDAHAALFWVPGGRVARMADQLSVSHDAPCELQTVSEDPLVSDPADSAS